jgi:RHS repeat-associated protein
MTFADAFSGAPVLSHRYLYGPQVDQVLVDEAFAVSPWTTDHEVLWLLADHQGTIRDIVDGNGTLRKHVDYDSFGNILEETYYDHAGEHINPAVFGEGVDQLFYYTGQEWDPDTRLQNNNARWYDPRIGRFLSADPSGFDAGDPNLYRYVGNSPPNGTDPTGLRTLKPTDYLPGLIGSGRGTVSTTARDLAYSDFSLAAQPVRVTQAPVVRAPSISTAPVASAPRDNTAFSLWGRDYVWPWSDSASLNPFKSVAAAATNQVAGKVGGLALGVNTPIATASGVDLAVAAGRGRLTGGKAVVNAGAGTLVSTATLGYKDYAGPFNVSDYDRAIGYDASHFIARGSTELLAGVGTGGAATLGRAGKAVAAFDAAGNVVAVGRGSIDVYQQGGLTLQNSVQIVGGGLGLGGNVAGAARTFSNAPRDTYQLPILGNGPFYPNFPRNPRDIAVDPNPPDLLDLNRPIGRTAAQNAELRRDIVSAQRMGARNILVNQHQVNAEGIRVGVNFPDLQFTLRNRQRVYVEYDTPSSPRAFPHLKRIQANDPIGKVILKTIPRAE